MAELPHTPEPNEQPDAWHQHAAEEGAPQTEHGSRVNPIGAGLTLLGIVFGFVFLFVVVLLYFESYVTRVKADKNEQVTTQIRSEYVTLRSEAQTRLNQPAGWIDRDAGTIRLPKDRAAQLVIDEYARQDQSSIAEPARIDAPEIAADG